MNINNHKTISNIFVKRFRQFATINLHIMWIFDSFSNKIYQDENNFGYPDFDCKISTCGTLEYRCVLKNLTEIYFNAMILDDGKVDARFFIDDCCIIKKFDTISQLYNEIHEILVKTTEQ